GARVRGRGIIGSAVPERIRLGSVPRIAGIDGGADDNFYVSKTSPAIDAGDSWNAPQTDALGYGRSDDPATANTGTNDYFTGTVTGTSVYLQGGGPGGVAQNWKADDNYWTFNFPAAFSFP